MPVSGFPAALAPMCSSIILTSWRVWTVPGNPFFDYAGTLGPTAGENGLNAGAYRWQLFTNFTYATGPGTLSLTWSHLPKANSATTATNPATTITGAPAYDMFGLNGTFAVTSGVVFRAGVDNLFDKRPPVVEINTAPRPATFREVSLRDDTISSAGAISLE